MLALLALTTATLSACTPAPEPEPTPTAAFASEEEAFAAAEEVYRAYLSDAAGRADGDESADPADYLTGDALESHVQSQRNLRDEGLTIIGASTVEQFVGVDADLAGPVAVISAEICINISDSRVLDNDGADVTPEGRATRGEFEIEFSGDADELLISGSATSEDGEC